MYPYFVFLLIFFGRRRSCWRGAFAGKSRNTAALPVGFWFSYSPWDGSGLAVVPHGRVAIRYRAHTGLVGGGPPG